MWYSIEGLQLAAKNLECYAVRTEDLRTLPLEFIVIMKFYLYLIY